MFTDGQSTAGGSAVPITTLAKENGVVIYCVVLKDLFGTDVPAASLWVSTPVTSFLSIAPTPAELEEIFAEDVYKRQGHISLFQTQSFL